jgi:hypothetical protein
VTAHHEQVVVLSTRTGAYEDDDVEGFAPLGMRGEAESMAEAIAPNLSNRTADGRLTLNHVQGA